MPHDDTIITYPDGNRYVGQVTQGQRHGYGILFDADGEKLYEGEWENDKKHGQGKEYINKGGSYYIGGWKQDKKHGKGIAHTKRLHYEGEMKDDFIHGRGVLTENNGDEYDGNFERGQFVSGKRTVVDTQTPRVVMHQMYDLHKRIKVLENKMNYRS